MMSINNLETAIGNFFDFIYELLIDLHKIRSNFSNFSENHNFFEKKLSIIDKQLLS